MSEEEKYDLSESTKGIGQLYPVLVDKKGRVIDGFHRLQADPTWRVQPLDNIDTDEKLLIARCVANWHRRQVGREEKTEWINGLAEIYSNQSASVALATKISEVTGIHFTTVAKYLDPKYKQMEKAREKNRESVIPASQVVESFRGGKYGKELVDRFRKEVLEEAQLSPEELAKRREEQEKQKAERKRKADENKRLKEVELEKKAEKKAKEIKVTEVKAELLKDPEFQREVLQEMKESIPQPLECPVLPPLIESDDPSIVQVSAEIKTTLTVICPKCGFKFEY